MTVRVLARRYGVALLREHRGRLRVKRVGDFAFEDEAGAEAETGDGGRGKDEYGKEEHERDVDKDKGKGAPEEREG